MIIWVRMHRDRRLHDKQARLRRLSDDDHASSDAICMIVLPLSTCVYAGRLWCNHAHGDE